MKYIVATLLFLFPTPWVRWMVNLTKHYKIVRGVRVGFSIIIANEICLEEGARIGSANLIKVERININERGRIRNLNFIRGNFALCMFEKSYIGNSNKISAPTRNHYHDVHVVLGENSGINNGQLLDMTDSVFIGHNSILAGTATQVWTHSGFRSSTAIRRLHSPVYIGDNCYIGARCCIMPGVTICDNVVVGAQTCVSKNLKKAGMYVSQPMRYLEFDADKKIKALGEPVCGRTICRNAANESLAKKHFGIE